MLENHLVAKTSPVAREENIHLWRDYRVTLLAESLVRIEQDNAHRFCDEATLCVWFRNMQPIPHKVSQTEETLTIQTEKITLCLRGDVAHSYVIVNGKRRPLTNKRNLKGTFRTLDECNGPWWCRWSVKDHLIEMEDGVASRDGVALLDDTQTAILKQDGLPCERPHQELDIYVFAYGTDYRAALAGLYQITGKTPIIPRFALGNWWSRYHDYTEKEYIHLMDRLAARHLPFTVATVDMDWHWSREALDEEKKFAETGKHGPHYGVVANEGRFAGWTGYSWNTRLFPDYRRFLKALEQRGLKVTLNLHPAHGVRFFEDMYPEMARAVGIDPATEEVVRFDMTDPKFINPYFQILHKPYERDGVAFWWMDWQQGSTSAIRGVDPLWCLNHYHTLDIAKNRLPLLLSRYCGIGSHRYSLGFSGDTHITWETLHYLPYFTATASNAGYTWWSHDIGGHMYGENNGELYARFVQFGVFSPVNRLHDCSRPFHTKEPQVYMGGTGYIAEEFLRLRHRLIPYLFSASYETTYHAKALIEPMYYAYPTQNAAYSCKNQYLFGGQLLVAPVTTPAKDGGLALTKVWLPEGHWTDIFTGDEYEGGKSVTMARWLETLPALLKEGGILPLDARCYTNDVSNPDVFRVMVANGNGTYTLHEEDGEGGFVHTVMEASVLQKGKQKFTIREEGGEGIPQKRTYHVEFVNLNRGEISVMADGVPHPFTWDDDEKLTVTLSDVTPLVTYEIVVSYPERDALAFYKARYLWALQRLPCGNDLRSRIWSNVEAATCRAEMQAATDDVPLGKAAVVRLNEQLPEA